jgi:SWI/SNF-related matrix-associated actin-dependent regulator of chromatin subfamily B protein 1
MLQPAPPSWLTSGLADLLKQYPNDRFEGVMRYSAVNTITELPCSAPPAGQPTPENVKYMYLPRIRCHDCPGKLYTPGPEMTVGNFEVHLKNRQHRERVDGRVGGISGPSQGMGTM